LCGDERVELSAHVLRCGRRLLQIRVRVNVMVRMYSGVVGGSLKSGIEDKSAGEGLGAAIPV